MPTDIRDTIFWIAVVFCAIAQLFILRAVLRTVPRASSPTMPVPRRSLEVAWAIIPAFMLAGAFFGAWRLMHPSSS